jgi:deoxyribodipyrimidine photolyase-related protein
MEVLGEATYVTHHIQKIVGFFAAMREFAGFLKQNGHNVIYISISDERSRPSFSKTLNNLVEQLNPCSFEYLEPDEYRVDMEMLNFCKGLKIPYACLGTEHFLTTRTEVAEFFKDNKKFLMETFYRRMRMKWSILMENGQPIGGSWNYDKDNRSGISRNIKPPRVLNFTKDVSGILDEIKLKGIRTIGNIEAENFVWPITRKDALLQLEYFLKYSLEHFGTYQDAMSSVHRNLFHSRLSWALNLKLLNPLEVILAAQKFWQDNRETIGIPQVEGFIRQILGWREYMRGVYWAKAPEFKKANFLKNSRKLPSWFWTGNTKMNCLAQTIHQSIETAHAHHIQRLMVTGNFALLAGCNPDEVDAWYLGIYIDAIEWVQLPNTRGMSQFAEGGVVATKPYVSSANYLNKMSDYCKNCFYDSKKRSGVGSCPFNSLYWNFFDQHRELLEKNPRLGMVYRNLNSMSLSELTEIRTSARDALKVIDAL